MCTTQHGDGVEVSVSVQACPGSSDIHPKELPLSWPPSATVHISPPFTGKLQNDLLLCCIDPPPSAPISLAGLMVVVTVPEDTPALLFLSTVFPAGVFLPSSLDLLWLFLSLTSSQLKHFGKSRTKFLVPRFFIFTFLSRAQSFHIMMMLMIVYYYLLCWEPNVGPWMC